MITTRRGFIGALLALPFVQAVIPNVWANAAPLRYLRDLPTDLVFRVSDSAEYSFGFSGFKEVEDADIVGQMMWSGNLQVNQPRQTRLLISDIQEP